MNLETMSDEALWRNMKESLTKELIKEHSRRALHQNAGDYGTRFFAWCEKHCSGTSVFASEPMMASYRLAFEAGANDERIRVVARLREWSRVAERSVSEALLLNDIAAYLERGGHRQ